MRSILVSALVLAGLAIVPARPAPAEPLEWDQARATELAHRITTEWRSALEAASAAPPQPSVLQQRARDTTVFQIEHLLSAARELHRKLRDGWNRDQTQAYFLIVRNQAAAVLQAKKDAVPFEAAWRHWLAAREAGQELARFYYAR